MMIENNELKAFDALYQKNIIIADFLIDKNKEEVISGIIDIVTEMRKIIDETY